MKQHIKIIRIAFITLFSIITLASCTKDASGRRKPPIDYNKAPRKPAPADMVGEWVYTEVSSTNVVDQYGHTVPAYLLGITFHIEADGKGWEALTSTVNTYTSSDKEDVNSDGTYEIDQEGDNIMFRFYTIYGEVWDNDHFSHVLAPEKCYPATYVESACTLGEDSRGVYLLINDTGDKYYKK